MSGIRTTTSTSRSSPASHVPFIARLLRFNDLFDDRHKGVEVIVLSRNSPKTGLRVMNSIEHYHLGITRAVFRGGPLHVPVHGRVQHVTIPLRQRAGR